MRKMTMIQQIQQSILQMKEEKNIFLLAHSYQNKDITEIADFVGDSFQMSLAAQQSDADTILVAGVLYWFYLDNHFCNIQSSI